MRSRARLATHYHCWVLPVRRWPPACCLRRLYLTSARQGPAWLLSSASTSKNPRYGTGGAGMNHQDRRGRRSTLHPPPAATQHDAGKEGDDDEVWPAPPATTSTPPIPLPAPH